MNTMKIAIMPGPSRVGKVFTGSVTFGGPRHRSKILRRVFQIVSFWPQICIKSTFGWGSSPDHTGGAYNAPQTFSRMVREHPSPCFLPLDTLGIPILAHTEWGCDRLIGPCDNGFPGPAVALDGPVSRYNNVLKKRWNTCSRARVH